MYFYNARWYDPYLNRWIQPDSIIPDPYNPLDWDRYAYVRNSPVNYTDPSGHCIQLDEGFCLHEDIPDRHFHLVDGSGLFENYVETAIADAIISEEPQSLNRIPKNTPAFMVGAAMENACEGLGYKCGDRFRASMWLFTAGVLGIAGNRYPGPSTRTLSGSISQDILGDPDCAGCGYRTTAGGIGFPDEPSQLGHIFRNSKGHFGIDNSRNRYLLMTTVSMKDYIKTDQFGNQIYARLLRDGTEVWVYVRDGLIRDGGLNQVPQWH